MHKEYWIPGHSTACCDSRNAVLIESIETVHNTRADGEQNAREYLEIPVKIHGRCGSIRCASIHPGPQGWREVVVNVRAKDRLIPDGILMW
jgi:hypothetical protein